MSEEFLNSGFFYGIEIIIYLYIVIFTVLNISDLIRSKTSDIINNAKAKLLNSVKIQIAYKNTERYFLSPAGKVLKKIQYAVFVFIQFLSVKLNSFDINFNEIQPDIIQPVNYAALLLRKCATDNQQVLIAFITGFIVLFYFILSIF